MEEASRWCTREGLMVGHYGSGALWKWLGGVLGRGVLGRGY